MARATRNLLTADLRGAIGKQVVFRVRNGKTFASKYPDMSGVKPSKKQLKEKGRFAKAVAFAQSIISDPAKKAAYKVKKGQSVFNAAVSDYMKQK
jgi:hypothetical protein